MTTASPEVAMEALWRCIYVSDLAERQKQVQAICDEHWSAIQAHFAAAGDDLSTHDRDWYVRHFTVRLEDYAPKDLLRRRAEERQALVARHKAVQEHLIKKMEDEQRQHYIASRTPRSKWKELGITDPYEERREAQEKARQAALAAQEKAKPPPPPPPPTTAAEFHERLLLDVIGQPKAVKAVSLAMVDTGRGCTLLIGPSGSGKTLVAEVAAGMAGRPFVAVDAAALVPAGIMGESIGTVLARLRKTAANMGEKVEAERGVIVLDEVDKLLLNRGASPSRYGPEVIAQMLRLLDGASIEGFKTDKLTVILAGAWHDLHIAADGNVTVEDLGLPTEFAGRIKRVARLVPLTAEILGQIIRGERTSPWGALLPRVDASAHDAAVTEAIRRGTGARGLRYVTTAVADHLAFLPADQANAPITAAVVAAALAEQ
jgi:hypothetical protein